MSHRATHLYFNPVQVDYDLSSIAPHRPIETQPPKSGLSVLQRSASDIAVITVTISYDQSLRSLI